MKRTVWQKAGVTKIDGVEHTRPQAGWLILSGSFSQVSQSYFDVVGSQLIDPTAVNAPQHNPGGNHYTVATMGDAETLVDNNSVDSEHHDND